VEAIVKAFQAEKELCEEDVTYFKKIREDVKHKQKRLLRLTSY
jgi:hypothetical protein